jgi:PIN domain nuclease of toxin-antitoxin system
VRLLFDTHVWLWFVRAENQLPAAFHRAIRDPANTVMLSVVSPWEVQIKADSGKLDLQKPVDEFLDDATLDFDILDISLRHIRTLRLLAPHHRDLSIACWLHRPKRTNLQS